VHFRRGIAAQYGSRRLLKPLPSRAKHLLDRLLDRRSALMRTLNAAGRNLCWNTATSRALLLPQRLERRPNPDVPQALSDSVLPTCIESACDCCWIICSIRLYDEAAEPEPVELLPELVDAAGVVVDTVDPSA
jgi:hypothetical protein